METTTNLPNCWLVKVEFTEDRGKIKDGLETGCFYWNLTVLYTVVSCEYKWMARFHYPNILIEYSIIRTRNNENLIGAMEMEFDPTTNNAKIEDTDEIRSTKLAKISTDYDKIMINPQIVGVKKERTKELFNNYFLRASRNSYTQKHMNSTNLIKSFNSIDRISNILSVSYYYFFVQ